ncbi:Histidine kinase-, DNA gyrase B-, and HSP90-like ATPase [Chitinophaga sp. CF118]|uniref:sensor histidine kinase n=1 Tax=Chitinophaga sp. CF118 TaxID=1884367 RepID=UPI0008E4C00A|nr:ATP-binding protein [Chitinophaga sp. CF118]SFD26679.1 Histidine kinase-, DNA gyrase B-, and HSP90-like ATPase [Chitinophaga sp. CF118]
MQQVTDNIYVLVIIAMTGTFILVISFLLLYVYNHNKILKQKQMLDQTEIAHQKKLMLTIFESQEEERKRIGGDLHDSVGAALSSLRLIIDSRDDFMLTSFKQDCKNIIDKVITDTRNIAHNLSPPTLSLYGLSEAITELADIACKSGTLEVIIDNQAEELLETLPHSISLGMYRVLEELMTNTLRHSFANTVHITFRATPEHLSIIYADNGIGYNEEDITKGMGLFNITNRLQIIDATHWISTGRGKGFRINILLKILL